MHVITIVPYQYIVVVVVVVLFINTVLYDSNQHGVTAHNDHEHHHYNNNKDHYEKDDNSDTSRLRRHLNSDDTTIERCGARDPTENEVNKASTIVAKYMANKVLQRLDQVSPSVIEIDTYFHVITDGTSGILDSVQLVDQLQVLNDSFIPYGFSFRLIDTTTTDNSGWYRAGFSSSTQSNMKETLRMGDASTLNVYFNAPSGSFRGQTLLGYSTFPWDYSSNSADDGVVIYSASLPFGDFRRYNEGKTLVHEVGHWLGLFHTFNTDFGFFQMINIFLFLFKIRNGCNTDGDGVDDTPRQRSPTRGCPVGRDSCPFRSGADPVNNFMDYSDDECYDSFTPGQNDRMIAMWEEYRAPSRR